MSFNTYARKVRNMNLPFQARRSAFRSCIQRYHWLIKQGFLVTYSRYNEYYKFDADTPDVNERLSAAMDALEKERNAFLEKLRLFERRRSKEKMRGRRSPSKLAVEDLYKCDGFTAGDDTSNRRT
jgi:hypothetical protein